MRPWISAVGTVRRSVRQPTQSQMYLLDTDHLSVLERGGVAAERLRQRLTAFRRLR